MNIVSVILCGGEGKRLAPISSPEYPKQFLKIGKNKPSLFQESIFRAKLISKDIVIISSEKWVDKISVQCKEIGFSTPHLILEPYIKNTAPSIAFAALYAKNHFPRSLLAIFPSDHLIEKPEVLKKAINYIAKHAEENIITFGIVPHSPNRDYGYIVRGDQIEKFIYKVKIFIEKPIADIAVQLIAKGGCFWNSGIFLSSPSCIMAAIKNQPVLMEAVSKSYRKAVEKDGYITPDKDSFDSLLPMQFDKTIIQNASNLCVIPIEMGWSDVGSIEALWNISEKDEAGWGMIAQDNKIISFDIKGLIKKTS